MAASKHKENNYQFSKQSRTMVTIQKYQLLLYFHILQNDFRNRLNIQLFYKNKNCLGLHELCKIQYHVVNQDNFTKKLTCRQETQSNSDLFQISKTPCSPGRIFLRLFIFVRWQWCLGRQRQRQMDFENSRPAWSTNRVPGQAKLHRGTLLENIRVSSDFSFQK